MQTFVSPICTRIAVFLISHTTHASLSPSILPLLTSTGCSPIKLTNDADWRWFYRNWACILHSRFQNIAIWQTQQHTLHIYPAREANSFRSIIKCETWFWFLADSGFLMGIEQLERGRDGPTNCGQLLTFMSLRMMDQHGKCVYIWVMVRQGVSYSNIYVFSIEISGFFYLEFTYCTKMTHDT